MMAMAMATTMAMALATMVAAYDTMMTLTLATMTLMVVVVLLLLMMMMMMMLATYVLTIVFFCGLCCYPCFLLPCAWNLQIAIFLTESWPGMPRGRHCWPISSSAWAKVQ